MPYTSEFQPNFYQPQTTIHREIYTTELLYVMYRSLRPISHQVSD